MMELYHQALQLPVKWHHDHHSGSIISRIRKAYEALKEFFQNGFMFFYSLVKFIVSFIAMMAFSPLFGIIGLVIAIIAIRIIFNFDKPLIRYWHETNEREHIVSSTLFDSLSNINTVITLRLQDQMKSGLLKQIQNVWPWFKKNITLNEWKWFVADTLVALVYVIAVGGYLYQNYKPGEVFLVGGLVTLVSFVNQFTSVFHDFAWQYNSIVIHNTDVCAVDNIRQAYSQLNKDSETMDLPNGWNSISISSLNYSHEIQDLINENKKKTHDLHDISISLTKGQRIAIIGESGGGKSTLLSVLRGLYPAMPGVQCSVDDRASIDLAATHHSVTLFPQDPEIFENTIRYNITMGLDYSDDDIKQACDTVSFQEVVDQLPNQLESNIKEKGVNLSGGQKQRLALARGILAAKDSDIILMDEPTSSVDPKTELIVYKRLFDLFKNKVMVSALHRIHLLDYFDYIYVMQDGKIVEEGSLAHLNQSGKIYKELAKHLSVNDED